MARFEGKVVVVTGASRGIGGSIAEAFLREGATVVGLARSENKDITGDLAKRFIPIAYDLGNAGAEQLQKLVGDVVARSGKIDVLVNNAGIIRRAPAVDFTEKDWDDVLRVNLTSPFFLTQAVARWWLKEGGREKGRWLTPEDRQHRVDALVPGRHHDPGVHGQQARHRGNHQGAGQ
jgi:2-deoxy-D-gluconate 3-dehydrogenase